MAIKKTRANHYYSDTQYDTLHYETQTKQVKILDANGVIVKDLDTELKDIKKSVLDVDAKTVTTETELTDLMRDEIGDTSLIQVSGVTNLVGATNKLKSENDKRIAEIDAVESSVNTLSTNLSNHNHDGVYLKITGGNLTGDTSVSNNKSFAGKNTSGANVSIGKVDGTNNVVLGSTGNKTIINASGGDLKLSDGTSSHTIFHSGNMGANSGLDADKLDGVQGSQFARKDTVNYYEADQFITEGKNLLLKAPAGSSQAGSIYFRDGDNATKGRVMVQTDGDMSFFAGSVNGHTFKADGSMLSTYPHILDASSREVQLRFRQNASDAGMGFYMNNSTNRMGLFDWTSNKFLFTTDRASASVQFANAIDIQGRKLSIQTTAPANPSSGDIWFDI